MQEGATVGRFRLIRRLGAGGMGEVYRAIDESLQRDVALKILPPGIAHDERRLDRLREEARSLAALSHPNILTVYDLGREAGVTFVVTELLEGETLRALLKRGRVP